MKPEAFYSRSAEDILDELKTDKKGLSSTEAAKRLEKYGTNSLPKKKKDSILKIFIHEFYDPMVLLLLVAIIASVIVGEVLDACVIAFIILVDAVMGTYQENKANSTAEALASMVATHARVMRDGKEEQIEIENLTVGDYVLLESGDKISADTYSSSSIWEGLSAAFTFPKALTINPFSIRYVVLTTPIVGFP